MATNRERLLSVFEGKSVSTIPFVPDLTYLYEATISENLITPNDETMDRFITFHLDHRCIPYYQYQCGPRFEYDGVELKTIREGNRQITRFTLNGQSLVQVFEYCEISHSSAPVKYPVETAKDLQLLLEIVQRMVYVDTTSQWDCMDMLFANRGYPICAVPRSPLPALLTDWAGVEHATFLMADEPNLCQEVMDAIDKANDPAFEILCHSRAPLLHFCDNLSAATIAGLWDRWAAEYYHRRVRQIHQAGKYCVSHLDGTLSGMIERLAQTGIDGIESITPSPVGDLSLIQVDNQLANRDTVIWGGIPAAMFCRPFTWEHIKRQVDVLIALAKKGRRIVVSSADQMPPDGDMRLVREVGGYLTPLTDLAS